VIMGMEVMSINLRALAAAILSLPESQRASLAAPTEKDLAAASVMAKSLVDGVGVLAATISTAHFSLATKTLLEERGDNNPWCHCAVYAYGFCMSVPSEAVEDDEASEPVPQDLRAVWDWARECGLGWVRLDSDANIIDELPEYNWDLESAQSQHIVSDSPSP
jgi:hypothetical protein